MAGHEAERQDRRRQRELKALEQELREQWLEWQAERAEVEESQAGAEDKA